MKNNDHSGGDLWFEICLEERRSHKQWKGGSAATTQIVWCPRKSTGVDPFDWPKQGNEETSRHFVRWFQVYSLKLNSGLIRWNELNDVIPRHDGPCRIGSNWWHGLRRPLDSALQAAVIKVHRIIATVNWCVPTIRLWYLVMINVELMPLVW